MSVIMVTGGARSGKSSYAEELCKSKNDSVTYIACAKITDDDMSERVKHHRRQRPDKWNTVEQYKNFEDLTQSCESEVYLLDCVTTMIANIMFDEKIDYDTCGTDTIERIEYDVKKHIDILLDQFLNSSLTLVLVTNEVGMGIVPAYRLGSIFRDIAGRMNQHIAAAADEVICMISGLPLKLK